MIVNGFIKLIFGSHPISIDADTIYYTILATSASPFRKIPVYKIAVLVKISGREINFSKFADSIIADITNRKSTHKFRIIADWFICAEQGSLYLLEAISTRENRKYRGMVNKIGVINSSNGAISYKPGSLENHLVSEKLESLNANYLLPDGDSWYRELQSVLDVLLMIFSRLRRFDRPGLIYQK